MTSRAKPESAPATSRLARVIRITKFSAKLFCWILLGYAVVVLIGLLPVNNDFVETEEGIEIFVTSTSIHADLILPIQHTAKDWRRDFAPDSFQQDTSLATHVAIGWGDRGFYLETPTWAELKVSTAVNAMFLPSDCCLHVQMTRASYSFQARSVHISEEQYRRLIQFIEPTFLKDADGKCLLIPGAGYGQSDAFYAARGNYHALNTCNSWVGRALVTAGVRAPWLAPMPKSPLMYLPTEP